MSLDDARLVAIVTGASRGIGLGIATALVGQEFRVCLTGRNEPDLVTAVAQLGGPDVATFVAGRADDRVHQESAVRLTIERFGRLDVLVNNAGINPTFGPTIDLDLDAARKTLDVNVLAALAWTQAAHTAWMSKHGGAIVNVASAAGFQAAKGLGAYAVSKAALIALTRQLGHELGPGIRVNAVAPAIVKTKFAKALYDGREGAVAEHYPLKRLGHPGDVAEAVAFLASDKAAWITGQTLVIDGGLMLGGRL